MTLPIEVSVLKNVLELAMGAPNSKEMQAIALLYWLNTLEMQCVFVHAPMHPCVHLRDVNS